MENAGPGSRGTGCGVPGYGVPGCGKRGVWKTRGVENAGSGGKRGAGSGKKTRGLSGKHGENRIFLTKLRSLNFLILNCNEN